MTNPFALPEADFSALLSQIHKAVTQYYITNPPSVIRPAPAILQSAIQGTPPTPLRTDPLGTRETIQNLLNDLLPGIFVQSSPHFYGFITGGALPPALLADFLVTMLDLDVMVHLPKDSIHTTIEHHTLHLLCDLFQLPRSFAPGSTITTGATGSNLVGLACAREWLFARDDQTCSVAKLGYLQAVIKSGVHNGIKLVVAKPHSSIAKAASVIGLGSENVINLPASEAAPWNMDLDALDQLLSKQAEDKVRYIVIGQLGEVNTGRFMSDIPRLRDICTKHGAWLHIDAAFGLPVRCVNVYDESTQGLADWDKIQAWCSGVELADSITSDGHKLLNVPYDAGLFFSQHASILQTVFENPGAAYLATAGGDIVAPCNINIENSRRFRALPIYAALTALGTSGYSALIRRLILHARTIAEMISSDELSKHYELVLPDIDEMFMVVIFRAKDPELNEVLAEKINATGKIWVSGTVWGGSKAVRIAAANWRVNLEEEGFGGTGIVRDVLSTVASLQT
ncbi:hypothetical protein H072_332 [Dactylellina haptotyla CBS 200.50]|uniref:Tyrosine decarboxylase n=1 Tax=Dactylellina haptotyla (strain CBS 200.50) TaxID=1284197 RepID=S8AS11_DACHA|nr:hypothetical protein H072_332 [Dactylellina haptotyla CBS 200.50]